MKDRIKSEDKDMAKKIALGATGVVITAGVVAAGAVLADQKMRGKIGKTLQTGANRMGKMATQVQENMSEAYPAVSHKIGLKKSSRGRKKSKAK